MLFLRRSTAPVVEGEVQRSVMLRFEVCFMLWPSGWDSMSEDNLAGQYYAVSFFKSLYGANKTLFPVIFRYARSSWCISSRLHKVCASSFSSTITYFRLVWFQAFFRNDQQSHDWSVTVHDLIPFHCSQTIKSTKNIYRRAFNWLCMRCWADTIFILFRLNQITLGLGTLCVYHIVPNTLECLQ